MAMNFEIVFRKFKLATAFYKIGVNDGILQPIFFMKDIDHSTKRAQSHVDCARFEFPFSGLTCKGMLVFE